MTNKIRDTIKSIKIVYITYKAIMAFKHRLTMFLLMKISPVFASKYYFKRTTGKKLNLKNPVLFNEKCRWLNLYWQNPLVAACADKYEVRSYIEECGYPEILNELYGVYEDVIEIEWNNFPQKYVIKCTHGNKFNIFCTDKNKFDTSEAELLLKKWIVVDYRLIAAEMHCNIIKPRIICEKYIETKQGVFPNDYKMYCFKGKVHCTVVCSLRYTGQIKYAMYDKQWKNKLPYITDSFLIHKDFKKPISYDKMIEIAERISFPFPFVRVDFYETDDGEPIFGEMTFTPAGCRSKEHTEIALREMGDMIILPKKYNNNWF